jgi:hypothetical protein
MEDNILVQSSVSATINAPIEKDRHTVVVLYAARGRIPVVLAGSLLRWCNYVA